MLTPSTLVVLGIAFLAAVVTTAKHGRPGQRRTHLSEREAGERANPFDSLSAGAENAGEGCRDCGTDLESESFRYCVSCLRRPVADD